MFWRKDKIVLYLDDDCPYEEVQRFKRYFKRNREYFDRVKVPKRFR